VSEEAAMTSETFDLDAQPIGSCKAILALGSNLGDRLKVLQEAVNLLTDSTTGNTGVAVSPVYETVPVGGPKQPDYLNAILVISTVLSPRTLLRHCQSVEEELHRVRQERWGPRTIDVDIITYSDITSDEPSLILPHPRAHQRAFVLAPWLDVEPVAALPGHGDVADLLAVIGREGVCRSEELVLCLDRWGREDVSMPTQL
jgi:2-amino-4-hydroxy-6-hydroxymethyldihydropteridine diphosphokinase